MRPLSVAVAVAVLQRRSSVLDLRHEAAAVAHGALRTVVAGLGIESGAGHR